MHSFELFVGQARSPSQRVMLVGTHVDLLSDPARVQQISQLITSVYDQWKVYFLPANRLTLIQPPVYANDVQRENARHLVRYLTRRCVCLFVLCLCVEW